MLEGFLALEFCENIGGVRIVDHDPDVEVHSNAIYVPFTQGLYLTVDPAWGIFHADGSLIHSATYTHGPDRERFGTSLSYVPDTDLDLIDDFDYVYVGPMMQHYGHFITGTLARFWYIFRSKRRSWNIFRREQKLKLLIHSNATVDELFRLPYFSGAMDALGVVKDDIVTFATPKRIQRLIIPHPAFAEQNHAHKVFGEMCRAIGKTYTTAQAIVDRPVYLSKQKLAAGVGKLLREAELAATLERAGVDIVFPELLSFPGQIRLFHTRRYIIGSGSALHTLIFSSRPPLVISIALTNNVNSNFLLIDELSGARTLHVQPIGGCTWHHYPDHLPAFLKYMRDSPNRVKNEPSTIGDDESGFMSTSNLPDPEEFALEILSLLRANGATMGAA